MTVTYFIYFACLFKEGGVKIITQSENISDEQSPDRDSDGFVDPREKRGFVFLAGIQACDYINNRQYSQEKKPFLHGDGIMSKLGRQVKNTGGTEPQRLSGTQIPEDAGEQESFLPIPWPGPSRFRYGKGD